MHRKTVLFSSVLAFAALTSACGDGPTEPGPENSALTWTFDTDLDGWSAFETGTPTDPPYWGTVRWISRGGEIVKLDGQGNANGTNAGLYRTVELPSGVTTLSFRTSPHNRAGARGELRVRIESDGGSHVLLDWEALASDQDEFQWSSRDADISAFAGQSVTIHFEHRDLTGTWGIHTQRYIDDIEIR